MWGYLRPLWDLRYWFAIRSEPFNSWAGWIVLGVTAALAVAGIGFRLWMRGRTIEKLTRRVYRRISALLISAGLTGLLLDWFTGQRVPVLGMRFFFLIWLFSHGLWGYFIWRHAVKELPALRAKWAEQQAYEKWLPKPKDK